MTTKRTIGYQGVVGAGCGIMTREFILDHSVFTDSTTTGSYEIPDVIPMYALRMAVLVETLETFNEAVTIAVGITAAGNTWTSATTGTCTTIGYKHLFPYGAATIITGAESTTSGGESVHVTLTHGSDYTLITSGKVKIKVIYLATQPY